MRIAELFEVYVVNLPERQDRLRTAKIELGRIGLLAGDHGLTIFPAIKPDDPAGFYRASVRGCFLSQLACLEDADRKNKHALILEDDIAFSSSLPALLPDILTTLSKSVWGFCYLGHENSGDIPRANRDTESFNLQPHVGDMIGAHFVMINRNVLPKLIEHLHIVQNGTPGDDYFGPMPVDGAYNIFRRLNPHIPTLISNPKMGWQRPSRSDITPGRFDRWKIVGPAMGTLRTLKHATLGS